MTLDPTNKLTKGLFKLPSGAGYRLVAILDEAPSRDGDIFRLRLNGISFSVNAESNPQAAFLNKGQEVVIDVPSFPTASGDVAATSVNTNETWNLSNESIPASGIRATSYTPRTKSFKNRERR